MNRTQNLKAYGWTALASGGIGLLVGSTALLLRLYTPGMLPILLASILAGVIIGTLSRAVCLFAISLNFHGKPWIWGVLLVIVGIGTAIAANCIGSLPAGNTAILVVIAEILGLMVAYINYRHFVTINEKLRHKQAQLSDLS